jgi:hypothetical protein
LHAFLLTELRSAGKDDLQSGHANAA